MKFTVNISDTPVTLIHSQGQQSYNENVDPEQGYNHAKFERVCFNGVQEKANIKEFLFSNKDMCELSPSNMCKNKKQWYIHDLLDLLHNVQGFN